VSKLSNWMTSGGYLPPALRDFHDQKEVFKTMHEIVAIPDNDYAKNVDWITGQVYVIDVFLWFMAKRGYTLQRSRQRLPFHDLDDDLARCRKVRDAQFTKALGLTPLPGEGEG
jgi:hypothetical protein